MERTKASRRQKGIGQGEAAPESSREPVRSYRIVIIRDGRFVRSRRQARKAAAG